MANEEDPKQAARDEAKRPEVQRLLRQFLKADGPKGNSSAYKDGWERIFGKKGQDEAPEGDGGGEARTPGRRGVVEDV